MMMRRLPLVSLPNTTVPATSVMTATSLGLRASKSSATRGRPPVMSLVLKLSRGIFANTSPGNTSCPFSTSTLVWGIRKYLAFCLAFSVVFSLMTMRGRLSVSRKSSTSRVWRPVTLSTEILTTSSKSSKSTKPLSDARMGLLKPSHSATRSRALTLAPSRTRSLAP